MAKWRSFQVVTLIALTVVFVSNWRNVADWTMQTFKLINKFANEKSPFQVASRLRLTNGTVTEKDLTKSIDCPLTRLKFLNESHPNYKSMVLLYSFPGSGNTWLRHLIQEATGFYTGSIYTDYGLYKNGFEGEMHRANDGSCIVYKSHTKHKDAIFKKVIVLLRNPFHAFKAAFNFEKGVEPPSLEHVAHANISLFYSNDWKKKVVSYLSNWQTNVLYYLLVFKGPVHLVLYEDLQRDLIKTMSLLVRFLNLEPLKARMLCMYHNREGQHHRKFRNGTSTSDIYRTEMKTLINTSIKKVSDVIAKRFPTFAYDIIHRYSNL